MSLQKLTVILGILAFLHPISSLEYHFKFDVGAQNYLYNCPEPNYLCSDNKSHFLCHEPPRFNPHCICHKPISLTVDKINSLVRSTNGIRSKVAKEFRITNMNFVYWSRELSDMAESYLLECKISDDPCLVIGTKKLKVSQNLASTIEPINDRWPGRVVRSWYMQIGPNIANWKQLKSKMSSGTANKFANMIHPYLEFMGCSGALITKKYVIACYYYPAFNITLLETDFLVDGPPCTQCMESRSSCSKSFNSLCGLDYELMDTSKAAVQHTFQCIFQCISIYFVSLTIFLNLK